ncbi:5942_t:CDS:2, partial [Gigaspora margarita]
IAHAINQHIKLGFNISLEKNIKNVIFEICKTLIAHLEPERKKNLDKKAKNKLPDLEKLQLKPIKKPNPNISISSISKNPWTISLPNNTDIHVKRLKKENIKEQLETHSILKDININRKELVKKLEL